MTETTKKIEGNIEIYEIFKDIVIPSLGIFATLFIGTWIANLLRNKEEKAKIKLLLIDSYMEYLSARTKDIIYETALARYEILNIILLDFRTYTQLPNQNFAFDKIKERLEETLHEIQKLENHGVNWSFYTYRFTFLLGKKKYDKEVIDLEKVIDNNMLQKDSRDKFRQSMFEIIKVNKEVIANLNSGDDYKIDLAINTIENIIIHGYNSYQYKFFNPYNEKVADLISK